MLRVLSNNLFSLSRRFAAIACVDVRASCSPDCFVGIAHAACTNEDERMRLARACAGFLSRIAHSEYLTAPPPDRVILVRASRRGLFQGADRLKAQLC